MKQFSFVMAAALILSITPNVFAMRHGAPTEETEETGKKRDRDLGSSSSSSSDTLPPPAQRARTSADPESFTRQSLLLEELRKLQNDCKEITEKLRAAQKKFDASEEQSREQRRALGDMEHSITTLIGIIHDLTQKTVTRFPTSINPLIKMTLTFGSAILIVATGGTLSPLAASTVIAFSYSNEIIALLAGIMTTRNIHDALSGLPPEREDDIATVLSQAMSFLTQLTTERDALAAAAIGERMATLTELNERLRIMKEKLHAELNK